MTFRTSETTAVYAYLRPEIRESLPFVRPQHEAGLEDHFCQDKNPQIADLVVLAAELGLPVQAVRVSWDCEYFSVSKDGRIRKTWSFWKRIRNCCKNFVESRCVQLNKHEEFSVAVFGAATLREKLD